MRFLTISCIQLDTHLFLNPLQIRYCSEESCLLALGLSQTTLSKSEISLVLNSLMINLKISTLCENLSRRFRSVFCKRRFHSKKVVALLPPMQTHTVPFHQNDIKVKIQSTKTLGTSADYTE